MLELSAFSTRDSVLHEKEFKASVVAFKLNLQAEAKLGGVKGATAPGGIARRAAK